MIRPFVAYVDDSGKHPTDDPAFILGAWVAREDDWVQWTDKRWQVGLDASPKIDYYKNNEAVAQKGCFAGFSPEQAAEKACLLSDAMVGVPVQGFIVTLRHSLHKSIVLDRALSRKGKLNIALRDPFFITFHELIGYVLAWYYHAGVKDRIDFIFDGNKSDAALRTSTEMYITIKNSLRDEPFFPLMGTVQPGDDKELPPLQAADMLASQMRQSLIFETGTPIVRWWGKDKVPLACFDVKASNLEKIVEAYNVDFATNVLTKIVDEKLKLP